MEPEKGIMALSYLLLLNVNIGLCNRLRLVLVELAE
jgi:hypothetical protein